MATDRGYSRGLASRAPLITHHALVVGLWAVAALVVVLRVRFALDVPANGIDFTPLRHAGEALLNGGNVYDDSTFVYPPSATPLLVPLSIGSPESALTGWVYLTAAALAAAVVVAVTPLGLRWAALAGAVAAALLITSDLAKDCLGLGNISLLMAPVAVVVLLCFERERWTAGSSVLIASLLVKPLLAPLILLPVLRRQWRALLLPGVPAAIFLGLSVLLVPGGDEVVTIFGRLSQGGVLTGQDAVHNLSLRGVGERLDAPAAFMTPRIFIAAVVVATVVTWHRRRGIAGTTAATGATVLLGVFLVGSLSESHWVLAVIPCVLLAVVLRRRLTLLLLAVPGLLLAFFPREIIPRYYLGGVGDSPEALQLRYLGVELLLLTAMALLVIASRPERRGSPTRQMGEVRASLRRNRGNLELADVERSAG